jgi:hypothetical protein
MVTSQNAGVRIDAEITTKAQGQKSEVSREIITSSCFGLPASS